VSVEWTCAVPGGRQQSGAHEPGDGRGRLLLLGVRVGPTVLRGVDHAVPCPPLTDGYSAAFLGAAVAAAAAAVLAAVTLHGRDKQ
jgi:hypothetical protein